MKNKLLTLTAALVASTAVTQAATIVPLSYTHAAGLAGPESNAGDDTTSPSRMNDNVISTGSWNDGLHVSWGQGTIPATDPTASMTFSFDQVYDFNSVLIYQNEGGGWGANKVRISTSTDNVDFSNTTGTIDLTGGSTFGGNTIGYTVDISALPNAEYVRIELLDATQWVMLSEVDFDGGAIPEPSAALLGGLGLLALLRRRRA